jgi:hypothetical protein
MQSFWIPGLPIPRIPGQEPSGNRVVVSGAQIIEPEIRIVLFAAVEVVVGRCLARGGDIAVGFVVVAVYLQARKNTNGYGRLFEDSSGK